MGARQSRQNRTPDLLRVKRLVMASVPVTASLILAGLRAWLVSLSRNFSARDSNLASREFPGGATCVWLEAASTFAMLDEEVVTAQMVQHLVLMTVGPALILLGFPASCCGCRSPFAE